jgi:hypothetical protein
MNTFPTQYLQNPNICASCVHCHFLPDIPAAECRHSPPSITGPAGDDELTLYPSVGQPYDFETNTGLWDFQFKCSFHTPHP